jgi:ectoine hydroxylase-related dioxygenase (phytanoyl-CoA dioxygenase family)
MWRNARHIAARLLGVEEAVVESWGHLIAKPPRHGHETPWHQDEAYGDPNFDYEALGAWVPLDDADVENGCMWFLPGSHRNGVLRHQHLGDDPSIHVLVTSAEIDTSAAVPVPLPAGGASFHHRRTLHYAGPNHSERQRRAWSNEFQTTPVARSDAAERPWVDEGRRAHDATFAERGGSRR